MEQKLKQDLKIFGTYFGSGNIYFGSDFHLNLLI
jgi:hypothetical protein